MQLNNVTLEMSLKPFGKIDDANIAAVCHTAFEQWRPLIDHADMASVMLWVADGSEILTYNAEMDAPIEWGRYLGKANPREFAPGDPQGIGLHSRPYLYMDNPPIITFGTLKRIVAALKRIGRQVTGKPIRVGATFDPGTEFAKSPFKFERHNEICTGSTDGKNSWVCCYTRLRGDSAAYAGFPNGIPEGTPLGAFLGRQARHFMRDLGFDYLWLSNGFGFGLETWKATGALFDGQTFDATEARAIRDRIMEFWRSYHEECPDFPTETRGTNLGVGIDLASDAVPQREIYRGGFNMMPPPNSPWAALDGDFGIELSGYMSRIAELPPDKGYPFRFYVHDPWWINSPWLDRYHREAHDIYLPLAIARLNQRGSVDHPVSIAFLSIDNSYGQLPEQCPQEVIPHILHGMRHAPDTSGPLLWVYPFDEYHDMTFATEPRLAEPYFGDWFIRQAINNALPLNSVISTRNFLPALAANPAAFAGCILVTPVPDAGSALSDGLLGHVQSGGRVLLYGPLGHAAPALRDALGVELAPEISGELTVTLVIPTDQLTDAPLPARLIHRPVYCAGGYEAVPATPAAPHQHVAATVSDGSATRIAAVSRTLPAWKGGGLAWVRGTNPNSYQGEPLLTPDDPADIFHGDLLLRYLLSDFGYGIFTRKQTPGQRNPVLAISRHNNAFFFSGYCPNTNVELALRLPQGAPLLCGMETILRNGHACYRLPRSFHEECRIFIEQNQGEVSCVEQSPGYLEGRRRIYLTGLRNATLRCYPDTTAAAPLFLANPPYPLSLTVPNYDGDFRTPSVHQDAVGQCYQIAGFTGRLQISW